MTDEIISIDEEGVTKAGNGWYRPFVVYTAMEFRRGWLGVWDALKEALFRRKFPRPQVPFTYTLSLYHKPEEEDCSYSWAVQIINGKQKVTAWAP